MERFEYNKLFVEGGKIMNKEKQVKEMAEIIARRSKNFRDPNVAFMTTATKTADSLYTSGYRKQSDAIDEFVKMLKDTSMTKWDYHEAVDIEEIDRIAAKIKGGEE